MSLVEFKMLNISCCIEQSRISVKNIVFLLLTENKSKNKFLSGAAVTAKLNEVKLIQLLSLMQFNSFVY